MAIFQPDLLLHSALKVGLADLRRNKFLLEDAYSNLISDPYLKDLYGEKEILRFKAFIDKEVQLYVEHRPPDQARFPAIVIGIGPGQEDTGKDAVGDGFQSENVDPETLGGAFTISPTIIGPTTPIAYDNLTGQITFTDDINLDTSNVFAGQFVYDNINNKAYEIQLVLDDTNLTIDEGSKPNLNGMTIVRSLKEVAHVRRSMFVYETHTLTLLGSDAQDVIYLYTIVMYILNRYKKVLLDARNFAVSTISYGPMYRASAEGDPNNLYGRDITIRGRVEHSWIESTAQRIEGFKVDLLIADEKSPDAVLPIVEKQGWEMEFDKLPEPEPTTDDEEN